MKPFFIILASITQVAATAIAIGVKDYQVAIYFMLHAIFFLIASFTYAENKVEE